MGDLLEVDSLRRVTLGQHAKHDRYLITEEPDGTLVLVPAVVMSELEARFLRNPELVEQVKANLADPSRMKRRRKA